MIELINRQWRWWFPRGTDLANITPAPPTTPPPSSTDNADAANRLLTVARRRGLTGWDSLDVWMSGAHYRSTTQTVSHPPDGVT